MTKTYKVIPIEDDGVVVDDNEPNDKAFCLVIENNIGRVCTYLKGIKWSMPIYRVIGTIGKRLDGIPLIELADTIMPLAKKSAVMNNYDVNNDTYKHGFVMGHKANTNKYSEEDMIKCFLSAREFHSQDGIVDINIVLSYKGADNSDLEPVFITGQDYVQSLQKQSIPTEVELETEMIGNPHVWEDVPIVQNKETNTITALNYK